MLSPITSHCISARFEECSSFCYQLSIVIIQNKVLFRAELASLHNDMKHMHRLLQSTVTKCKYWKGMQVFFGSLCIVRLYLEFCVTIALYVTAVNKKQLCIDRPFWRFVIFWWPLILHCRVIALYDGYIFGVRPVFVIFSCFICSLLSICHVYYHAF